MDISTKKRAKLPHFGVNLNMTSVCAEEQYRSTITCFFAICNRKLGLLRYFEILHTLQSSFFCSSKVEMSQIYVTEPSLTTLCVATNTELINLAV